MALSNLRIISKIIFCLLLLNESNALKLNGKCWKVISMALSQVVNTTATMLYQYTKLKLSLDKWIFVLYLLNGRQIEY